jgi:hypothetical protein
MFCWGFSIEEDSYPGEGTWRKERKVYCVLCIEVEGNRERRKRANKSFSGLKGARK